MRRNTFHPPKARGDAPAAFDAAALKVEGEYRLATEHHNPMEMHASTVEWHGDGKVTVYEKTQDAQGVQAYLASAFKLGKGNVRVVNAYVGGGFGSGLRPQWQVQLATMAALLLERSVRVVMTREQMFYHAHRPECVYQIKLGAEHTGKLSAVIGDATTSTSRFENNMEDIVTWGMMNYDCPNAEGHYTIAPRDTYTSADMSAPGAAKLERGARLAGNERKVPVDDAHRDGASTPRRLPVVRWQHLEAALRKAAKGERRVRRLHRCSCLAAIERSSHRRSSGSPLVERRDLTPFEDHRLLPAKLTGRYGAIASGLPVGAATVEFHHRPEARPSYHMRRLDGRFGKSQTRRRSPANSCGMGTMGGYSGFAAGGPDRRISEIPTCRSPLP